MLQINRSYITLVTSSRENLFCFCTTGPLLPVRFKDLLICCHCSCFAIFSISYIGLTFAHCIMEFLLKGGHFRFIFPFIQQHLSNWLKDCISLNQWSKRFWNDLLFHETKAVWVRLSFVSLGRFWCGGWWMVLYCQGILLGMTVSVLFISQLCTFGSWTWVTTECNKITIN